MTGCLPTLPRCISLIVQVLHSPTVCTISFPALGGVRRQPGPKYTPCGTITLQRHLQNMLFYHKGLRVRKKSLPFVSCDRKASILRVQFWATHSSVAVGIKAVGLVILR